MKKVYLASRYSRLPEMAKHAKTLAAMGIATTSRWITGAHEMDFEPHNAARFAWEDLQDIEAADTVISFSEEPRRQLVEPGRGGRHNEFGYALALGQRMIVIGPRESIFHFLPEIEVYPTWADFLTAIHSERSNPDEA